MSVQGVDLAEAIWARASRYTAAAVYAADGVLAAFCAEIRGRIAIEAAIETLFPTLDFIPQLCVAESIDMAEDNARAVWNVTEYNRRTGRRMSRFFSDVIVMRSRASPMETFFSRAGCWSVSHG